LSLQKNHVSHHLVQVLVAQVDLLAAKVQAMHLIVMAKAKAKVSAKVKVRVRVKAKARHSSKIILQSQQVLSLLVQASLLQVLSLAAENLQVKSAHLRK
jgi:hypothetical protein